MRRLTVRVFAGVLLASVTAPVAAANSSAVRLKWVGGPTMVIRFGPIQLLTDPVLGEGQQAFRVYDPNIGKPDVPQARASPLPKVQLNAIDLVLLSHIHEDHLDRAAVERIGTATEFIVPPSQLADLRNRGGTRAGAIAPGEVRKITRGGYAVTITAVQAQHSPEPKFLPILGDVNGYWLEFRHGSYRRTVYWAGDSFPPPTGVPAELRNPDLFIPHLGGVGAAGPLGYVSMSWRHALAFAEQVQPRAILPVHHSTFSLYREPIELFLDAARAKSLKVERLKEGEELQLR